MRSHEALYSFVFGDAEISTLSCVLCLEDGLLIAVVTDDPALKAEGHLSSLLDKSLSEILGLNQSNQIILYTQIARIELPAKAFNKIIYIHKKNGESIPLDFRSESRCTGVFHQISSAIGGRVPCVAEPLNWRRIFLPYVTLACASFLLGAGSHIYLFWLGQDNAITKGLQHVFGTSGILFLGLALATVFMLMGYRAYRTLKTFRE